MAIESQFIDGKRTCLISGELCIWEVADNWRQLLPLIIDSDPLAVDLSKVEGCDGSGVQIIYQFLAIDAASQKPMSFLGVSDSVITAMQQTGFKDEDIRRLSGEN